MKAIEQLKKGDWFTRKDYKTPKDTQVFVFDGYCRSSRKYAAQRFSDISDFIYLKKGTTVFTEFEF